jgi:hypothetical protein
VGCSIILLSLFSLLSALFSLLSALFSLLSASSFRFFFPGANSGSKKEHQELGDNSA